MKFLSQEWFDKHVEALHTTFKDTNRNNTELVEVYENCWGEEGKTIWIYYQMKDGLVGKCERGEGEENLPAATFRCFGEYDDYVLVAQGKLDPKKGLLTGKFTLEGNLVKAISMLGTYMKVTECKRIEGMDY